MQDKKLTEKHCVPCEGGTKPLSQKKAKEYLGLVPEWELVDEATIIRKKFKFKNFAEALRFTNKVGEIAESENHHPDIELSWGKMVITLTTHAIDGLSENDFILAAKIDQF